MSGEQPQGLSREEAARRLEADGPNQIHRAKGTPWWRMLLAQLLSPLVLLLLAACVLSAVLGEVADAIAIAAIVVLNSVVGFTQEFRAQNAVLALRALTGPHARVRRGGEAHDIPAREVVVGDVLMLAAGDLVAADGRVLGADALMTNEAALTGESLPVDKSCQPSAPDAPLAERKDRVFMGTAVSRGSGLAEVVATGMKSELGRIAHLLDTAEDNETPLQRQLVRVGRALIIACLIVVAVVAGLARLQGQGWLEVLMIAVPLAVAAVPEGLPAMVTVALAVGVRRMSARHVLVRRLPAVETLGAATVICTDKTGTLTTGQMAVRELWATDEPAFLAAAAACCDAALDSDGEAVGDPTEIALLRAAAAQGIDRATIEAEKPRVRVFPFDAERKRMSVLRADGRLYVKGAPELLLPRCVAGAEGAEAANAELAARGLRVLAVALGASAEEEGLTLLGLAGLADPPRPEAIASIAQARRAGIVTVMITGDQPATAVAIARELGLLGPDEDPAERVHARVTPEEKLQIIRAWKERGAVVAMTGDGVNDAPALRESHIGIAMGRTGTEVTREAADLVLTDDNFASIIAAVQEGRGIWDNIQKSIIYLLAGNTGELLVMLGAALLGLPVPLVALQLLWINLVTDGLPALVLVLDPPAPDVLSRPPRSPDQPMLGRDEWLRILATGVMEATLVLGVFTWVLKHQDLAHARQLAFSTLVVAELLRAFASRSRTLTLWEVGPLTNLRLLAVVVVLVGLQLALSQVAWARELLRVAPLSFAEMGAVLGLGLVPVTVLELRKLLLRTLHRA